MNYNEFYQNYLEVMKRVPDYRLGQHFINLFIENDSDTIFKGLWQAKNHDAVYMIEDIINNYQWSYEDMPLKKKGESR